jgi:hypothetical protein
MKKLIPLLIMFPLLAPAFAQAAGPYKEEDFKWEPFTNLYKRVIIAGVNKIARTNPDCTMPDLTSIQRYGGTPDDPEFDVTCNEPGQVNHVHFSKTDVTGDPASDVPLEE